MAEKMESVPLRSIGKTGLVHYGGVIDEEYLAELRGGRWKRVVRRMQDDSAIAASLLAIQLLIRQVSWSITGDDEETAVFVEDARLGMKKTWDEVVSEILSFLPWGFAVMEIVYRKEGSGRIGWADWSIRGQETIESWGFDEHGDIRSVEQVVWPYRSIHIPYEKFLLFRTTAAKGNPEGKSLLRGAYDAWFYARHLKRSEAISVERDATGIAVAKIPAEVIVEGGAEYDSYVDLVTNLRVDDQAGVVIPSNRDEHKHSLYELSLLTTNSTRQINIDPIISRYEREKTMALLTDVIMLGHGNAGAYNLAQQKQEMLTAALNAYLDTIAGVVDRYAIPRLLKLNGYDVSVPNLPKLIFSRIENIDLESLGLFIKRLSDSGFDWSEDDAVDSHLRQQAALP